MGAYKSARIAALLLYCAQGAAIEERQNRGEIAFSTAALLFYCAQGTAIEERRNRKGFFFFFLMWTARSGPSLFDHLKSIFFQIQQQMLIQQILLDGAT